MPYRVNCPTCKTAYFIPDDSLGKKLLCKKCHQPFAVGNPKPPAPAAPKPAVAGRTTTDLPPHPAAKPTVRHEAASIRAASGKSTIRRKKSAFLIVGVLAAVLFVLGGAVASAIVAGLYFLKPRQETSLAQAPIVNNEQRRQIAPPVEKRDQPADGKASSQPPTEEAAKPRPAPAPLPDKAAPRTDKPPSARPPATETPQPSDPPVSNRDQLPRTAEVGKPFKYQLSRPMEKVRMYSLYSGPKGLKVSKEGLIEWTPEPGQTGRHQLLVGVVTAKLSGSDLHTIVVRAAGEGEPPKGDTVVSRPPADTRPARAGTPTVPPPAATPPSGAGGDFQILLADAAVTALDVSEDGQFLFTAHMEKNRVVVWDVKTAKPLKTLECAAPQCLLFRAGKLYAGCHDKPSLFVFDQANDWSLVDELKTSSAPIAYLAAPQGKAFTGQILVSVAAVNIQLATRGERVHCEVDVKKKSSPGISPAAPSRPSMPPAVTP